MFPLNPLILSKYFLDGDSGGVIRAWPFNIQVNWSPMKNYKIQLKNNVMFYNSTSLNTNGIKPMFKSSCEGQRLKAPKLKV